MVFLIKREQENAELQVCRLYLRILARPFPYLMTNLFAVLLMEGNLGLLHAVEARLTGPF